ncbi:Co2+/Mg2+ efflux protein ApaG [Thiohalobacter sp. IOR34]|uniref:Co2+/Mg2+ efflux protein ApaG n=1 Tax=Thiohalobacter sp. IOR34 TaxID=3057176 RepID=UPI0025AF0893|nr:Co2+/Mg2+ efflux protein ApaG [Thiohalobacter sp. IOR34]WJW75899.1 Co2+/Mg2+ efflux protein ApaG [Thiohalobacter sp. IOR34]
MNNPSTHNIQVSVETDYVEEQSDPAQDRYVFTYTITIHNAGQLPARLLSRHWLITDSNGKQQEVRGKGVVGEQPRLQPGQSFQYTSGTLLETDVGSMRGSYRMVDDEGVEFDAEIPAFSLSVPRVLH